MFRANPITFIILLLLTPVFGIGLLGFLIWYVKSKATHLEVADGRVAYTSGLLSKDRVAFAISAIRSVKVEQTFFERWTGAGTVRITTAGDEPEVTARGMPEVEVLQRLLKRA